MSETFNAYLAYMEKQNKALDEAVKILNTMPAELRESIGTAYHNSRGGHWAAWSLWFHLPLDKPTYRKVRSALHKQGWSIARNWGTYHAELRHDDYKTRIVLGLYEEIEGSTCKLVVTGTKTVQREVEELKVVCA